MYNQFEEWLDSVSEDNKIPENAVALNFNLYECEDNHWGIQLAACESFDEDDDWACDEIFSTKDNMFIWQSDCDWEDILQQAIEYIREYLETGGKANLLKSYLGIGVGFIDGDIEVIYKNENY